MKLSITLWLTLTTWLLKSNILCLGRELKCYICLSNNSWDDCEKEAQKRICHEEHADVCIKQHLIEHAKNEGVKETFVKMCGRATLCTDKYCAREGKTCQVDCCHKDFCNGAREDFQESSEKKLICYLCYSTKSWEDCRRHQRTGYCPKGHDEVCVTIINSKWQHTNTTRYVVREFAKHCSAAESCTDQKCIEEGARCDLQCCHTDYCNGDTVVTFSSHAQGRVTVRANMLLAVSILASSTLL